MIVRTLLLGCSNSIYQHGYCKFSKSSNFPKFKLDLTKNTQEKLKEVINTVTDLVTPLHDHLAPDSHQYDAVRGH